jgi:hypothetical protein
MWIIGRKDLTGSCLYDKSVKVQLGCFTLILADFGAGICKARFGKSGQTKFMKVELRYEHLFSVVDLPDEGFPTKPMSGSRGMILYYRVMAETRL